MESVIINPALRHARYRYEEYLSLFSVVFQDYRLFQFSLADNVAGSFDYDEQKVALARALYKDAPFVILDEPTAALVRYLSATGSAAADSATIS